MIGPNMATMLAFVFTDAAVSPDDLAELARRAADQTFNCISVEGHTSTNDTLLLFANGASQAGRTLALTGDGLARFGAGADGRLRRAGPGHRRRRRRSDAPGHHRGRRVCATIARRTAWPGPSPNSALVKTAIFGADPNWGRIVSAAGYCRRRVRGRAPVAVAGRSAAVSHRHAAAFRRRHRLGVSEARSAHVHLRLRFTLGPGRCTFWTCDLTHEYVRLNADYTT